jgi:osmoprotectant transport system substrate-binding protein
VRDDIAEKGGAELRGVVDQITKGLTEEVIQELNARVDLDKKTPEQVAGEYLSESDLVQG